MFGVLLNQKDMNQLVEVEQDIFLIEVMFKNKEFNNSLFFCVIIYIGDQYGFPNRNKEYNR